MGQLNLPQQKHRYEVNGSWSLALPYTSIDYVCKGQIAGTFQCKWLL